MTKVSEELGRESFSHYSYKMRADRIVQSFNSRTPCLGSMESSTLGREEGFSQRTLATA